jgi:thymidylate kinase
MLLFDISTDELSTRVEQLESMLERFDAEKQEAVAKEREEKQAAIAKEREEKQAAVDRNTLLEEIIKKLIPQNDPQIIL